MDYEEKGLEGVRDSFKTEDGKVRLMDVIFEGIYLRDCVCYCGEGERGMF